MATKNAQSIAPSRLAGALLSAEQIALAKIVPIERIADERNIRLRGNIERVGPCPVCGGDDRFAINIKKQLWNCRGCQTGGDVIRLVQFLDGVGFREAVATLIGERHVPVKSKNFLDLPGHKPNAADDARSRRFALALWRQARPPDRTPVEVYLHRRCLRPPSPDVIRFHGRCPFGKSADGHTVYTPAMIALVRNIVTNEPQAVHRTALDLNGNKVEIVGEDGKSRRRMALGPIQGGAVKLTDDAEVTKAVGVGEGIETTLSLARLPEWQGSPVWSLLSKNGVRDFPVLPGIETLMVAVDHDAKRDGEKAATVVNARWRNAGCEVLLAFPEAEGDDLNDVIREVAS